MPAGKVQYIFHVFLFFKLKSLSCTIVDSLVFEQSCNIEGKILLKISTDLTTLLSLNRFLSLYLGKLH